ncbi:MAG: DNA-deoxyinosine glycosylase [Tissierellaceae bacterium]
MKNKVKSLSPIVDHRTKVLILGSMPGRESLQRQEYYANSRNKMWEILFAIFDERVEDSYQKKIEFLKDKEIRLWDVLKECEREGSLDKNIKDEVPNDFKSFLREHPNIELILFNGKKAFEDFKKMIGIDVLGDIEYKRMASTSPTYAIKIELKIQEWGIIKEFI